MKIKYDFHIHSALSPCADNDMTPVNIVAYAKFNGLDMIAVADHNAIENVETAIAAGKAYGVTVVPAVEVQTAEDIHVLCLFKTFEQLKNFHRTLSFPDIKNNEEIFGEQLIVDEDDNITGRLENLLLVSSTISSGTLPTEVKKYGGIAIAAHIDREANGMVQILGAVEECYDVVELSLKADKETVDYYGNRYKLLIDSDAHTLDQIGDRSELDLRENSIEALFEYLTGEQI